MQQAKNKKYISKTTNKNTVELTPKKLFKLYETIKNTGGGKWAEIGNKLPKNLKESSLLKVYIRPKNSDLPYERRFFDRTLLERYYVGKNRLRIKITDDTPLKGINVIYKYEGLDFCNRRFKKYLKEIGYETKEDISYFIVPEKHSILRARVNKEFLPTSEQIKQILSL